MTAVDGFVHPRFADVAQVFRAQLEKTTGGAAVCVVHRGETVVDLWGGRRTEDDPWERDTVAMSFSTTKGVASTALHLLVDRGLVDLDAPVATYWSGFEQAGKEGVLVRHVLTHSAGLHRIRPIIDHADWMLDWDRMVGVLAAAPPAYPPGTANGYHALTYGWLVGEIIRRVDGRPIDRFVADEIARPLDLDGLYLGCPPSERHRVAPLGPPATARLTPGPPFARRLQKRMGARMGEAVTMSRAPFDPRRAVAALVPRGVDEVLRSEAVLDAVIPAANGHFTARSLARMYSVLAGRGTRDGVTLLSPEAVDRMAVIQSMRRDLVLAFRMRWRLGYHLVSTTRGVLDPAFGHFGYGGSGGWCDPTRDLAVGFTCNRGSGTPIGDIRIMQLGSAVMRSVSTRT